MNKARLRQFSLRLPDNLAHGELLARVKLEPPPLCCQHAGISKLSKEIVVVAGRFRCILAVLLLASGGTHVLAQQHNSGVVVVKEPVQQRNSGLAAAKAQVQQRIPAIAAAQVQARPRAPQQSDLRHRTAGAVFRDCATCPEMAVIPPGSLTIGPPESEAERMARADAPHAVAIASAIGMGKYEVTRAQFARFVRETGYAAGGSCFVWNGSRYGRDVPKDWRNPGFAQTDSEPVVCVNWSDAKAYTAWLTQKAGRRYRLPTEVEWEYAARAGDQTLRPWGDNPGDACRYANVADASAKRDVPGTMSWQFHECDDRHAYTAPAGRYPPNGFGLYDMLGNAWEWTEDCLSEESAGGTDPDAARAPPDAERALCTRRVLRGGGWVDSPAFVNYDFRFFINSDDRDFYIGFRVVATD